MKDTKARIIASELLKAGKTVIWISPEGNEKIQGAMTKEDVRALIKEGVIKKRKRNLQSKGRARVLKEKKAKGRKKGKGKKQGKKSARAGKKETWMKNVRAQRRTLKELKESGVTMSKSPRKIYEMIKGGYFKGKKHIQAMVEVDKK
ncbi:MAG: 50S ribosomal protein L19e [Candidatus Diapherotrites archaeon CG11_big_fil_rev_8_21_14_0_20_37_9]|nr:MAG: 50S ribosomal protein L19e [Candidatus Diapherotrites archaeon CG11_big_fil_rev_8_21_14_0_20_37_9]